MKRFDDAHIHTLMRQRWKNGKRTMARDDYEMVIAQILGIFNLILWGEVISNFVKGFFS